MQEECNTAQAGVVLRRVSIVGIGGNVLLTAFKLLAGILGHSGAMVSDAVHSLSDVFATLVALIGVKLSEKGSDREHPYGHERLECVASIVLAGILFATGAGIGWGGLQNILHAGTGGIAVPGRIALAAAVVSIVSKEAMFWYTRACAKKLRSSAFMADAWHHRSDALSSIGALVGIVGARLGYPVLDAVASLVICAFVIKVGADIFRSAVGKMVDTACSVELESQLHACIREQPEVQSVDLLRTRMFGEKIYVEAEILLPGEMLLSQAHGIAEQVHDRIEQRFSMVKHISIHVNAA